MLEKSKNENSESEMESESLAAPPHVGIKINAAPNYSCFRSLQTFILTGQPKLLAINTIDRVGRDIRQDTDRILSLVSMNVRRSCLV